MRIVVDLDFGIVHSRGLSEEELVGEVRLEFHYRMGAVRRFWG